MLVTAVGAKEPKDGVDFFPLTVDYEEKLYAAGKIPGGFLKREGKASEKAILCSRLIDRPIRPLFPKGYRNDVQVVATVLSVDMDNTPDVLAMVDVYKRQIIERAVFDRVQEEVSRRNSKRKVKDVGTKTCLLYTSRWIVVAVYG